MTASVNGTEHVWYEERGALEALDVLETAVWIFDIENKSMWWSNKAGVRLWGSTSREALLSRSFADMSESTERRLRDYLRRFARGEKIEDTWTYYPIGKSVTANVTSTGVRIESGRLAMMCEATPARSEQTAASALRSVESLRHLSVAVEQLRLDGTILEQNPTAMATFGTADDRPEFASRFADRKIGEAFVKRLADGPPRNKATVEARMTTSSNATRWFSVDAQRGVDPATSEQTVLVNLRDVDERKKAELELRRARDEAESATRTKSDFFAIMTHEIRTPLNGVIGFSDLLSETALDQAQQSLLGTLRSSAGALMAIINDLLDFSKLEAGKMEIERVDFAVDGVIDSALAIVRPKAESKQLKLRRLDDGACTQASRLIGDPNRLRQVLLNILSNAIKFTDSGSVDLVVARVQNDFDDSPNGSASSGSGGSSSSGSAAPPSAASASSTTTTTSEDEARTVAPPNTRTESSGDAADVAPDSAKAGDDVSTMRLRFTVVDTGIGIAEEDRHKLFRQFSQASSSAARKFAGTGLGLAICQKLVEMQGGRIGVKSTLGRGSTFFFELPFQACDPDSLTASPRRASVASFDLDRSSRADAPEAPPRAQKLRLRVLVAEDALVNQKLARIVLAKMGHDAVLVENGKLALDKLAVETFDLVLMDIQMPVMDGLTATKRIRADLNLSKAQLPVIGLTADFRVADLHIYVDAGMNTCIGKPCRVRCLREAIDSVEMLKKAHVGSDTTAGGAVGAPSDLVLPELVSSENR